MAVYEMPGMAGAYMQGIANNPYKDRVAWNEAQGQTAQAYDQMLAQINPMQYTPEQYAAIKSRLESQANVNNRAHMNVDQYGRFQSPAAMNPSIDSRYMTRAAIGDFQTNRPVEYQDYVRRNMLPPGHQGPMVPPAQAAIDRGVWQNMQHRYDQMLAQQKAGVFPAPSPYAPGSAGYMDYVSNAIAKQKAIMDQAKMRASQSETNELDWVRSGYGNQSGYNVGYQDPLRIQRGTGPRAPGTGEKREDEDRRGY